MKKIIFALTLIFAALSVFAQDAKEPQQILLKPGRAAPLEQCKIYSYSLPGDLNVNIKENFEKVASVGGKDITLKFSFDVADKQKILKISAARDEKMPRADLSVFDSADGIIMIVSGGKDKETALKIIDRPKPTVKEVKIDFKQQKLPPRDLNMHFIIPFELAALKKYK